MTIGAAGATGRPDKRPARRPLRALARSVVHPLAELRDAISQHHLTLVAAGVAFYGMLAILPAFGLIVSVYGLVGDPHRLDRHLDEMAGVLPDEALRVLAGAMRRILAHRRPHLGLGVVVGSIGMVWSACAASAALIPALNIAYGLRETRSFARRTAVIVLITSGACLFVTGALGLISLVPGVVHLAPAVRLRPAITVLRWPILALLIGAGLTVLYRFAPDHPPPHRRWLGAGTLVATALWLAAAGGFSLYVARLGGFDATYGSLGAAAILLMWLYLTAFVVLLGAEINACFGRAPPSA